MLTTSLRFERPCAWEVRKARESWGAGSLPVLAGIGKHQQAAMNTGLITAMTHTGMREGLIHSYRGRACGDEKIFVRKNLPHFS